MKLSALGRNARTYGLTATFTAGSNNPGWDNRPGAWDGGGATRLRLPRGVWDASVTGPNMEGIVRIYNQNRILGEGTGQVSLQHYFDGVSDYVYLYQHNNADALVGKRMSVVLTEAPPPLL